MARTVATRSLCSRAQVGCVIVTHDNRVEAITYNGPPPNFRHGDMPCTSWCDRSRASARGESLDEEYHDCPAGHAEANAIARSDWTHLQDGSLYVTGSVCMGCAKLIAQTGIKKVYHVVNPTDAHRRTDAVEKFLLSVGVNVMRLM